jgi:hypothetical protein
MGRQVGQQINTGSTPHGGNRRVGKSMWQFDSA